MMHLTEEELAEVTGYKQPAKQRAALLSMSIPFKVNPRGRILVLREDYTGRKPAKRTGPNWAALEKVS